MLNNIKALREAKGFTLRELADRVHIADSAISRMENGMQNIYLHQAIAFADVFKVSLDDVANRVFLQDNRIVYVDKEINYQSIMKSLGTLTNKELAGLMGAIDLTLNQRDTIKPQEQSIPKPTIKVIRQ